MTCSFDWKNCDEYLIWSIVFFSFRQDFTKLPSLHHIDLTSNALKPLQGNEFSKARNLATLLLTGNKDVVTADVPIVQNFKLKTLNLANCSITHLSDNIFQNLSSLVALYLENNPLDSVWFIQIFFRVFIHSFQKSFKCSKTQFSFSFFIFRHWMLRHSNIWLIYGHWTCQNCRETLCSICVMN